MHTSGPSRTQPSPAPSEQPTPIQPQPSQGTLLQFPTTATPNLSTSTTSLWKLSPHIPLFTQLPPLKRYVAVAIDKAIKEILTPVMERSATIASITTRDLVMKDFALEPNEQVMRAAAHFTVQSLASSLAMVACKDPLRVSIANQLRVLLQANVNDQVGELVSCHMFLLQLTIVSQLHQAQRALIEHAVQTVCTDNLDTACSLIEKTTAEKALRETDEALAFAFDAR